MVRISRKNGASMMRKQTWLILISISVGLMLLFLSWYQSYPVAMDTPYDLPYYHFSYFYWVSLAVLFASCFAAAMLYKSDIVRWGASVGTFLLIYSQTYFYYMVAGADASLNRGLTESFISTGDLSSINPFHFYFQWPNFFLYSKMAVITSGIRSKKFGVYTI